MKVFSFSLVTVFALRKKIENHLWYIHTGCSTVCFCFVVISYSLEIGFIREYVFFFKNSACIFDGNGVSKIIPNPKFRLDGKRTNVIDLAP